MTAVAIIPARGGSKRLLRKNVLPFKGKPMIAWTIEAALASGRFFRIIVSTDDEEIAAIAHKYWIMVDRRPDYLATDEARVVDVCADLLNKLGLGNFDRFACLYATAPMRTATDIQIVMDMLETAQFALAATDYALSPHQALKINSLNEGEPMWPDLIEKRHDEMPRFVVDNGSTYGAWIKPFLQQKTFYGNRLKIHVMPRERSVDIDTKADLDYALWLAGR